MTASKPTVIFVPGAWHTPEVFGAVRKGLESHGYPTIGIVTPSVGAEPPLKSWEGDVNAIQVALRKVVDDGGDVVLVVHSYGALPACEAAKGFVKLQREKEGLKGGIVRLVYLCAILLSEGQSLLGMSPTGEHAPWNRLEVSVPKNALSVRLSWRRESELTHRPACATQGDYIYTTDTREHLYNDLDEPTSDYWTSTLKHHSAPTFQCPVTYAAWRDIPSTYLFCEKDNAVPLEVQKALVEKAGGFQTETCSAGHSPFLSQPEVVVDVIRRAAGEEL
ncbi:hypothetical protein MMC16_001894 [Acarospora aff. strigata]|nr:hypothetical protein [Acarospora aff. strigata]